VLKSQTGHYAWIVERSWIRLGVYSLTAGTLVAGALLWTALPGWDGKIPCTSTVHDACGDGMLQAFLPTIYWSMTVPGTALGCVAARWKRPTARRSQVVWSAAVAGSVFLAAHHNLTFAIVATTVSVVALLWNPGAVFRSGEPDPAEVTPA
jgi:hypothetical protein